MAVAVLVLETLAVQRRPSGRAADQEAARPHVAGRPGEIADPLEAEHRVVDVERDHRRVAGAVGGRRRDPRRHGARLVDAFLKELAVLVLAVVHQLLGVFRLVELAGLAEDAELAEHALHAEGAALVRHDRHDPLADLLVAQQRVEDADERHRGRDLAPFGALQLGLEGRERRDLQRFRLRPARRQAAAQGRPALPQIDHLRAVLGQLEERHLLDLVVGDRQAEAVAELLEHRLAHLLLLVGDVLALAGLAHAVALDGLGQDHGRLALVGHGGGIGGVDLAGIVAAARQAPDLLVGHAGDTGLELGVLAEEVLADIGAVLGLEVLVLAVDAFLHAAQQAAVGVGRDQRVPRAAPQHLDDVPAGTPEVALQLLDDLAVAAHRAVEALEVAVDDEDEVVELLAAAERDGA